MSQFASESYSSLQCNMEVQFFLNDVAFLWLVS